MSKKHLGIIGLGVMGRNLALNAASQGFSVVGYDADAAKAHQVAEATADKDVAVASSLAEFVEALETPRRIWMMVPAGKPVDAVLGDLKPVLSPEDIVIDGGNSYFKDTERRAKDWETVGLRFFGMGVSGGEEGALHGPCLMPGGHEHSYRHLEPLLTKMAAQTSDGALLHLPRTGRRGPLREDGPQRHRIRHYAIDLRGLRHLRRHVLGLSGDGDSRRFRRVELRGLEFLSPRDQHGGPGKMDPETGQPLVDLVLDTAGQKGTGKWTAQDALDLGVAVPTLTTAVLARILSGPRRSALPRRRF